MDSKFQAQYTALKILRQRCEYLQQRLDSLEEENCQLKLQKVQVQDKSSYNNCLEEQIILLNKQNNSMMHKIQMVTMENQNMWSQLSKLMTGDDTLGNTLSISTHQSKEFHVSNKAMDQVPALLDDCSKESLEEISLKLINGILIGKTELESQYSQMIDLQKESNFSDSKQFSKLPSQFDCRATTTILKGSIEKMKTFRDILCQQKIDLNNAILNVKTLPFNTAQKNTLKSNISAHEKGNKLNLDNFTSNIESKDNNGSSREINLDSDKTCPMCAKNFSGSFTSFYDHVTSHFEDSETSDDTHSGS